MKLKDTLFVFAFAAVNVTASLVMIGLMAHLVWYAVSFGWNVLP